MSHHVRILPTSALLGCVLLAIAGCDDPQAPEHRGPGGITYTSGFGLTDTIQAVQDERLVIRVPDVDSGTVVLFAGTTRSGVCDWNPSVVCERWTMVVRHPEFGGDWQTQSTQTTDARGVASVEISMWDLAGEGGIAVYVPSLGIADTVPYRVLPGRATQLFFATSDQALVEGGIDTATIALADRAFNVISMPSSLNVATPALLQSVPGGVVGLAPGLGKVTGTIDGAIDTLDIPVLPGGRVAMVHWSEPTAQLVTMRLDGEERHVIQDIGDGGIHWSVDATRDPLSPRWVYHRASNTFAAHLFETGLEPDDLVAYHTVNGLEYSAWPDFTPDGEWLYFEGRMPGEFCPSVFRRNRSGDVLERIPGPVEGDGLQHPQVSPDGRLLAVWTSCNDFARTLSLIDVVSGDFSAVEVGYLVDVAWSPDSRRLAVLTDRDVHLVDVETGAVEKLFGEYLIGDGLAWSPDGEWVLVTLRHGFAEIVHAATGDHMSTALRSVGQPEWVQ